MNYELFMGEALAEARSAMERGERPNAAVAVVDLLGQGTSCLVWSTPAAAARARVRFLVLTGAKPHLLTRVFAPPLYGRRNGGRHAEHRPQPLLLP